MQENNHLLTWMTFWPLIGAFIILCSPARAKEFIKQTALLFTIPSLICAVQMLLQYDPHASYQFVAKVPWIQTFHIYYYVGADGLSVPMLFLTALLCPLCILASWDIDDRAKGYFALFLILETGMLGVFIALDFFLFYVFWEVMLLPMYFLIGIWGGPRREYAAIKFFLYTLLGSVFLFIVMIVFYIYCDYSFDLTTLGAQIAQSDLAGATRLKWWLFLAMYIAFAIKIPAFPFHTWLPDAHVEAPTAISVILAGILLKMGTYGLLRISYPLLPDMALAFAVPIALIALINIVYGALVAMAQTDLKKLVAYSSISHMGFVMLGMAAMTPEGMNGAVMQMFSHGMITAMLFLLVGVIYDRAHHRDIDGFGGLAKNLPVYAGITCVAFFAGLGLPGFSGFIAEVLVFLGAFGVYPWITILAATSLVITATYLLWTYQRMFLGPLNEKYEALPDCTLREKATLYPLAVLVLLVGIFPQPVLNLFSPTLQRLIQLLGA
ncbi:MAG TPA: NADH-quinone oxidoreductase subunit M [bacterium]|nr:NADH-quinone oxidoreductase subunit M [Candidatus Omnitrophota bacterium]HOJ59935.1 NADH-quinone oxidoreductase subunit M [bacterium]HOL94402.1 NADH-quinone oxidoreductase subunit M [bacterium]HPO99503.1 NADH-quinone oxidoreductase subunit M [bacterium]HXK94695.1 NADH-quinone oxidoreductase subunit M [bacterium]